MAALDFPPDPINGTTYTGDNGITYTYQDGKWTGTGASSSTPPTKLKNSTYELNLYANAAVSFPNYTFPISDGDPGQVLTTNGDGVITFASSGGGTIWTNTANGCLRAELSGTGFQAYTTASHLDLQDGGIWNIGSYQNSTSIGNDQFSNQHDLSLRSGDATFITTNLRENGNHQWKFDTDAKLTLPNFGAITSPNYGFSFNKNSGKTGAPELGTDVLFATESLDSDIVDSEVYMGSGYGEFRSIYNKVDSTESGLAYAGVEGFNYAQHGDVNFAGMVSQTPNIDSMYALSLNEQGQIVIGFTQNGQTQQSNDWSVAVGTLTTDYTVNGLFANTNTTVIGSGLSNWTFGGDGTITLPAGGDIRNSSNVSVLNTPGTHLVNGEYTVTLDEYGTLTIPGPLVSTNTGTMRFNSDVNFEIEANNRIQLIGAPLNLATVDSATVLGKTGDLLLDTDNKIKSYDGVRWNDVVVTKGNSKDIQLGAGANFRKSTGERVAYHTEIPTDISQLADINNLLAIMEPETVNIDGGGAYAMFDIPLRADGGFSSSRWGAASTIFDGGATAGTSSFTLSLNGGGA